MTRSQHLPSLAHPSALHQIWLFAGSGLTKLALAIGGAALLAGPLNTAQTWVAGHSPYIPSTATHLSYTANVQHLSATTRGVVVDLEAWPETPRAQQQHPLRAYREASRVLAHHGQWMVATPALDLVHTLAPRYPGPLAPEFVRLDLAGRIAPYARVYDIQAQGFERNPVSYQHWISTIARQIHAANPQTQILAGLSTNPAGLAYRWPSCGRMSLARRE
jgi:hypothetical protein